MCGFVALLGRTDPEQVTTSVQLLAHRGPDDIGVVSDPKGRWTLGHTRLSIIDVTGGHQPLQGCEDNWLVCNGEIYNYRPLAQKLSANHTWRTQSDSEVILHSIEQWGIDETLRSLDGDFAFVYVKGSQVVAGRDPIGVKPLFYGKDSRGGLWMASEVKSLQDYCEEIHEFPPGHYFTLEEGFVPYYDPTYYIHPEIIPSESGDKIRQSFETSVIKRLMSDVPVGVFLSGGLDSSLVAAIAAREMKKKGSTIKSFSVGVSPDAYDMVAAREVASFIGTEHHQVLFTVEEGVKLISETIWKTETYDVTTIRCSIPMLIMSKYVRAQGVKVVLSGEGSDEIFGGYLYFNEAPNKEEFHAECVRRIKGLYKSDVQRADRATMGAGVEARVPFLDKDFLEVAMNVDPVLKESRKGNVLEKTVLRNAFESSTDPLLPHHILWRKKEQFQDGVGYGWVDGLKAYCEGAVTDLEFAKRKLYFPHNTPQTKEAFLYRKIHASLFPHPHAQLLTERWIPKWQEHDLDPSGRASKYHPLSKHA